MINAPIGSKVWVLVMNESKKYNSSEISVLGVFSSRENALHYLADVVLKDEEKLFASIKWEQARYNTEYFEGVDAENVEYDLYTTTVDVVNLMIEPLPTSEKEYIRIITPRHSWLRVSIAELKLFKV